MNKKQIDYIQNLLNKGYITTKDANDIPMDENTLKLAHERKKDAAYDMYKAIGPLFDKYGLGDMLYAVMMQLMAGLDSTNKKMGKDSLKIQLMILAYLLKQIGINVVYIEQEGD
jgi:hypothetical protein